LRKFTFSGVPDLRGSMPLCDEVTPGGVAVGFGTVLLCARAHSGRAAASTFSKESTRADRLSDSRNARREDDNPMVP